MNELTTYGLSAMGAATAGTPIPAPPADLDMEAFRLWAYRNGAATLLYPAIRPYLSENVRNVWQNDYKAMRLSASIHISAMARLLQSLEKDGLRPVVLKGRALASLYAVPDDRVSSDTDLLALPVQFESVREAILRFGANATNTVTTHHVTFLDPMLGEVELHRHVVLDHITESNTPLPLLCEPYSEFEYGGGCVALTLGVTDHLILLLMHAVGHVINGGFTARQLLDIALYLRKNAAAIDSERTLAIMRELRYDGLIGALMTASEHFALEGFVLSPFERAPEALVDQLLCDVLENHGFERENLSKEATRKETLRLRAQNTEDPMKAHGLRYNLRRLFYALALPRQKILYEFPWASKSSLHLLWARVYRAAYKSALALKRKARGVSNDPAAEDRLRLYRSLGMLQK